MSWPHGNSVNDFVYKNNYMGTDFQLRFPTVDNMVDRIVSLKGNCLLYKVDIERAFRQFKIRPTDQKYTGIMWGGNYYVDTAIPFGYRHGSLCCQRVTDAVRFIMHKNLFYLMNYIDDLLGCDTHEVVYKSYSYLIKLMEELGLPISREKLFPPSEEVVCLGININVKTGLLSIPFEKMSLQFSASKRISRVQNLAVFSSWPFWGNTNCLFKRTVHGGGPAVGGGGGRRGGRRGRERGGRSGAQRRAAMCW